MHTDPPAPLDVEPIPLRVPVRPHQHEQVRLRLAAEQIPRTPLRPACRCRALASRAPASIAAINAACRTQPNSCAANNHPRETEDAMETPAIRRPRLGDLRLVIGRSKILQQTSPPAPTPSPRAIPANGISSRPPRRLPSNVSTTSARSSRFTSR